MLPLLRPPWLNLARCAATSTAAAAESRSRDVNTYTHSTSTTGGYTWNGPSCQTCGALYLGSHTCSPADLVRRAAELLRLAEQAGSPTPTDRTAGCPCRPENGGNGVCGCTLGGPQITC